MKINDGIAEFLQLVVLLRNRTATASTVVEPERKKTIGTKAIQDTSPCGMESVQRNLRALVHLLAHPVVKDIIAIGFLAMSSAIAILGVPLALVSAVDGKDIKKVDKVQIFAVQPGPSSQTAPLFKIYIHHTHCSAQSSMVCR